MTTQTESRQPDKQQGNHYRYNDKNDNDNVKEKDIPDYPLFSKEWEWEECCHHTIE